MVTLRLRFVVGCLACLAIAGHAATLQGDARRAQASGQVSVSVGIIQFYDESGAGLPAFGPGVARLVRQRLSSQHRDALAKMVTVAGTGEHPASIEQLQALGKQYAVRFVVQGGVLPIEIVPSADARTLTVSLYADVVALESGETQTLRVDGSAPAPPEGLGIADPASTDVTSAAFAETPVGRALGEAVGRMADAIYQAMTSPAPTVVPAPETAAAPAAPAEPAADQSTAVPSEQADAELQQLVADAQNAIASYGGVAPDLAEQVRMGLEQLDQALVQKADQLSRGEDTNATDQSIAGIKESLRASVNALVQAQTEGQSSLPPGETGAPTEGVMTRVNTFASDLLSLVQKIQELQSLLGGAADEAAASGEATGAGGYPPEDPSAGTQPVEQAPGSVTGVVVEGGQPVGGAEVTETSTGTTTTTAPDGSYTLSPLPAGLFGTLSVKRRGALVATGQIPVAPGRASLADFQLERAGVAGARLGVIGSTATTRVKPRNAGILKGRVLDARGNPAGFALVSLPGVGVVRTNARGEFQMSSVAAGTHPVSVRHTSLGAASAQLTIAAGKIPTVSTVRLLPPAAPPGAAAAPRIIAADTSGGHVRGRVRDQNNKDLPGVRVNLLRGDATLWVLTDKNGRFSLRNVAPGSYRAVVARSGFETATRAFTLRARGDETIELKLKRLTALVDTMREVETAKRATAAPAARPTAAAKPAATVLREKPTPVAAPVTAKPATPSAARVLPAAPPRTATGQVRGHVLDAQTRKPVAGATVSLSGGGSAHTDRYGAYRIDGVRAGQWEIAVSRSGYLGQKRRIALDGGSTATVDFSLRAAVQMKR